MSSFLRRTIPSILIIELTVVISAVTFLLLLLSAAWVKLAAPRLPDCFAMISWPSLYLMIVFCSAPMMPPSACDLFSYLPLALEGLEVLSSCAKSKYFVPSLDCDCCAPFALGCCLCIFTFHCFPSFTVFATLIHVSSFFISFPFVVSVSSHLRNSLISSSHLLFGLPTNLFVWYLVLRPGFHFAAFFVHRSSGSDAILIARRHFILLCVSI